MPLRIAEDLREHIAGVVGPLARSMAADHPLLETRVLDSTGILDLAQFMEEQYGIQVVDDEFHPDNFGSIDKLVAFVQRKRSAPP